MNTQDTSTAHSPLPWHICSLCEQLPNRSAISDNGGHKICEVESYPYRTTGKADAAFIVEACNNYERVKAQRDELLAVVKGLVDAIKQGRPTAMLNTAAAQVAIAKAEGGQP